MSPKYPLAACLPVGMGEQDSKSDKSQRGSILVLVIVFCAVFMTIGVSLIQIMSLLHKASLKKQKLEQTFQIAEAGVNFYKWRLAHEPEDFTGGGADYDYYNVDGEKIGYYHLEIGEPPLGSTVVTVTSTGYIDSDPGITRTLEARLAMPALSDYAFLTNSNAWIGEGEEIVGKMHSNGGVRFDGESDSTVDSPLATYICGPEHDCDNEEHVGVWGAGSIQELWRFPPAHPINSIDFNQIILDLDDMKTEAGQYLGDSGEFGWHLSFNYSSSTFSASKVTETHQTYGWDFTDGWQWRNIDIKTESAPVQYNLPANGVIFVEDQVWVDGEIDQRLTVASANFTNPNIETSIIINDDIVYDNRDGSSAMGLIAQKDILIP
ncbi:MAG: pilus assembly PilX N-terminal domain-containing protein, partial [Parcubacteria group bacterium]